MHSPSLQSSPSGQTLKHFPQCCESHCVLTQTSSQISSPGSLHSPPVVIVVEPVSVPSDVPVSLDEVESLADEDDESSEVDVLPTVVVGSEDDDDDEVVGSEFDVASEDDDWPFVLDIESIPVDDALIESPVVEPLESSPSPPQAHRARPTSADITTGADACV